jgi:hypothetical protein
LPLSLVITNFFTEGFEEVALNQVAHKPICWVHYVDDTVVIWPHGPNKPRDFLGRVLSEHYIKSVGLLLRKFCSFLLPVCDSLKLKTPGVYSIPCEFDHVYTGQTGCLTDIRLKEHVSCGIA